MVRTLIRNAALQYRLIKPMVEHFNGRIKKVVQQTRFESSQQLEETLIQIYNSNIPQRNLGHVTPVEALDKWRKTHPELLKKSKCNHTVLDSYIITH